jgi:hypothetical protein
LTRARATEIRVTFSVVEAAATRLSVENNLWPEDADAGVVPPALLRDSRSSVIATSWTGRTGSFPRGCRVTPQCDD